MDNIDIIIAPTSFVFIQYSKYVTENLSRGTTFMVGEKNVYSQENICRSMLTYFKFDIAYIIKISQFHSTLRTG